MGLGGLGGCFEGGGFWEEMEDCRELLGEAGDDNLLALLVIFWIDFQGL